MDMIQIIVIAAVAVTVSFIASLSFAPFLKENRKHYPVAKNPAQPQKLEFTDRCQWTHKANDGFYQTRCGHFHGLNDTGFMFCPYCGRLIKVFEKEVL